MTEAKKTTELKPEVLAISEMAQGATTYNKETKNLEVAAELYEKSMPEGLTPETASLAFNHLANFTAGTAHGVGIVGVDTLKRHKSIDELTASIPLGDAGSYDIVQKRERITFKPRSAEDAGKPHKPEDEIKTYGAITSQLNIKAGNHKSALFKNSMTLVKEAAAAALSK